MESRSKDVASRFLEETEERDRIPAYDHLCTADYREHGPGMPQGTAGLAEAREIYRDLMTAFALRHTAESMIAEDDLVSARFTVRGRHVGEYQGSPPSGRTFKVSGQITFRFRGGKIAETWIHWDHQSLLEQLGAPGSAG
ncbi:ester cyclase [Streptomyces sp. NPDC055078]